MILFDRKERNGQRRLKLGEFAEIFWKELGRAGLERDKLHR